MTAQIACMIVGLLLVSAAAMWGLNGLHQDYGLALASYHELREVYGEVGSHLATARELLGASPNDRSRAAVQIGLASHKFDLFLSESRAGDDSRDDQAEADMRAALNRASGQLDTPAGLISGEELQRADMKAVEDALLQMRSFSTGIRHTIESRKAAATQKRRDTIITVGLLCGVVVVGSILLGVLQYRSVMLPLHRLADGVRKIAAGEFKQRLDERGTPEFSELANEFNRMAAELDEFYHRLERKVADKSRELIRSERLASVGYLAAGVAHEINNPLSIIAGYAEYSLGQLKQQPPASGGQDDASKSLQVICDEAFRCKEIIGKLLSLARPGEANRQEVDLSKVAAGVADAVGGLRDYRDRKLTVVAGDAITVHAIEAEMKQIVLNLTVNALEAVPPGGEVRIELAQHDGWAELHVRDNGRGMSEQTLERVFEPFFTDKRGVREPGTGLGLSITHAIVESHGGRITAASEGPGKGSEFVVRLPAATRSIA
jgi:signal transduction histidine kinase